MNVAVRRRILVLGAGGFIGSRVVEALAAGDWAVPIAARHRTAPKGFESVESMTFDARDASALQRALHGVDAVVNCVAGDAGTIVSSAKALFDRCSAVSTPPRVVHLSTMMVYGGATGTVYEDSPLLGDWDAYSAAKAEVERLSRACTFVVHLRPGIVYGPGSPIWSERIGRWLCTGRLGDLGTTGHGYCNLVHVDDVVEAIVRALRMHGIEGDAFNLALPSPPTWNEYFRLFAANLGTECVRISRARLMSELYLLAPPLKFAEVFARAARLNWVPPAPIRPWLPRLCRHPIRLAVEKAERVLGMRWTPLEQGLRQTVASIADTRRP